MILNSIKGIKKFAKFDQAELQQHPEIPDVLPAVIPPGSAHQAAVGAAQSVGLNLKYTINLNLPATSDIAVFNAIFKSLKENLLKATDED